MIFYGLADARLEEAVDLYATRAQAEETLAQVLADEPEWVGLLSIVAIDLSGVEPSVAPL